MADARAIAGETARASYGKLLAWLASRTGDVAAAEDALADAFRAALEHWPQTGAPTSPEAWLLTAARRKLIDGGRRQKTRTDALPALALAAEEAQSFANEKAVFPDERLKLMFICAHPAIDAASRTPLMLQTVLGLDAARIASAFLVSPAAMSARLVRAKQKIKRAGVPFETPEGAAMTERLDAVLQAIYAAYGTSWDDVESVGAAASDLAEETLYLARLMTRLAPDAAEAWGLFSLVVHAHARRDARRANGAYIPLDQQDTALWNDGLINIAEMALARAWRLERPGRFQLEAAIQSAHVARLKHGVSTERDVVLLYKRLIEVSPSIGARIGYAAALLNAGDPQAALSVLNHIEASDIACYQPYWAVRAQTLRRLDETTEARNCFDRAIGLSADAAVRHYLANERDAADQNQ